MFGALTAATIMLFTFLRTDMSLTQRESYALFVAYVVFVAWILAEVTNAVGGILPA
jgi:cation:H+ antiporter